ncbi:hypothetical protein WAI453_003252 [Rhynchosporium graminicola]|uniref:Related to cytosine deaminase n=1 Tax=Rhynchosporium graminicola TaxID=2792576 RepID=A0A1E1LI58_9HELO|nr:related to cytosine deaminase [Rhynchosporium commune]
MSKPTTNGANGLGSAGPELSFKGVYIAGKPENTRWDISCKKGLIDSLDEHVPDPSTSSESKNGVQFLCPSLCHPHIHIDKCFLLSHPKYADLKIETGDFAEALKLTSEAKSRFEHEDLMERGRALIEESINFGVTHLRAFVEVDLTVKYLCLEAGLALKKEFKQRCHIQICVFAQDPIVSYRDKGKAMKKLLDVAVNRPGVAAFGSAPYVEQDGDRAKQLQNIEFAISTAIRYRVHLDFHIDYNLDPNTPSMIGDALALLHKLKWPSDWNHHLHRSVVFGHCTRLTLFSDKEWLELQEKTRGLPVAFVGLPTSDLFMMGRPAKDDAGGQRVRGTLQVLDIIEKYGLNAAIGINNVGNAFTPQGSCDPLSLASLGVGVYQAATNRQTDLLLQCVSNRAKLAMGIDLPISCEIDIDVGDPADFVVFGNDTASGSGAFRSRRTIQDLVNDPTHDRTTVLGGKVVSRQRRRQS